MNEIFCITFKGYEFSKKDLQAILQFKKFIKNYYKILELEKK